MNPAAAERYRVRLAQVVDHIDAHLAEEITVERLSSVAAFSKYHFHRQFSAHFGIGVYRYILLRRLKRASYLLAFRGDIPITDIAAASGYEGPEAFARAFRRALGQSPSEFRERPRWESWHDSFRPLTAARERIMSTEPAMERVEIVTCPDTRVAALEYRGSREAIGDAIRRFIEWRRLNDVPPRVSATFNVVHHHPTGGDDGECRYDLCAAVQRPVAANSHGIIEKIIPGGRCALLRYTGAEDGLEAAVDFLYSRWLPQSGEEPRDFPLYFQRIRFFPDVPEHEAVTHIHLPLR